MKLDFPQEFPHADRLYDSATFPLSYRTSSIVRTRTTRTKSQNIIFARNVNDTKHPLPSLLLLSKFPKDLPNMPKKDASDAGKMARAVTLYQSSTIMTVEECLAAAGFAPSDINDSARRMRIRRSPGCSRKKSATSTMSTAPSAIAASPLNDDAEAEEGRRGGGWRR